MKLTSCCIFLVVHFQVTVRSILVVVVKIITYHRPYFRYIWWTLIPRYLLKFQTLYVPSLFQNSVARKNIILPLVHMESRVGKGEDAFCVQILLFRIFLLFIVNILKGGSVTMGWLFGRKIIGYDGANTYIIAVEGVINREWHIIRFFSLDLHTHDELQNK